LVAYGRSYFQFLNPGEVPEATFMGFGKHNFNSLVRSMTDPAKLSV
jgi:hypothetical protein